MDYVVDASVVVKWFIPEEESDEAGRLKELLARGEASLYSPRHTLVEVANALTLHPLVKISEDAIIDAVSASEKMVNLTDLTQEEWRAAVKLAREIPTTVYDSAYLALSLKMDMKFITADSKLYARLPNNLKPHVALLKELQALL